MLLHCDGGDGEIASHAFSAAPAQQVCDYMLANEALFRDVFDSRDAFLAHVRKMRKVETWATHLDVTAAVHMTMRPVHLITDAVVDEQCDGPTVEPWSHNRKGYPPE